MRFILRRLMFYAVAFWAAITLNFLLPRLMPGSPLDALISNYGQAIQSNPDIIPQLKAMLGSADEPIWQAYPHYLRNVFTGDFGISVAKQVPVGQIIGNTLPWSIFLVGVGFLCSFVVGTTLGMFAAWRRGGFVDNVLTPGDDGVAVVPGVLPQPRRRLLPRAQARVVPDPARLLERRRDRLQLARSSPTRSATPSCRSS